MSQRKVLNMLAPNEGAGPSEPIFVPPAAPSVSTKQDMKASTSLNQKEVRSIGGTIISYKEQQIAELFDDKSLRVINKNQFNLWRQKTGHIAYPAATANEEVLQKIQSEMTRAEVLAFMPRH